MTGPSSPIVDLGCGFVGNPDFYGLRIRLGVYLQWLTAMLAHYLLTEIVSENLDVNAIFVFALSIALVSSTARNEVQDAEIVVLLQLCWGFILGVLTIWGHRLREDHSNSDPQPVRFPPMGSLSRLTLTAAICAYSICSGFPLNLIHRLPLALLTYSYSPKQMSVMELDSSSGQSWLCAWYLLGYPLYGRLSLSHGFTLQP